MSEAFPSELEGKVVRDDVHPLPQIEPMGGKTLHTGVQMQLPATRLAGAGFEPGK